MKKITGILMTLAALSCFIGCSKKAEKGEFTAQKGKLLVAMEIGYPPFEYYADDGKTPMGFDVLLGAEIAKKLNLEVEYVDTAWDGIFAGLDTDRYDVVISAATITEERLKEYDFSEPYIGNGQAIILRKDSTLPITKMADLAGLNVGYQAETTSDYYTKKVSAAEGWTYKENGYDKVMLAYDDLKNGRIDAVVSDELVAVSYLNVPDTVYKEVFQGTPDEFFGVCMKKGNKELQEKVNKAIADMKADGTMKKLYESVFNTDLSYTIQ